MKNRPTTAVFRLLWLKRIDASDQRSENTMKKLVQFIIVLLGMTMATTVITQQANAAEELNTVIDSLQQVIKTAKEDTNKVNALNMLSEKAGWQVGNYDTAFYYAANAKRLAERLSYKKGMGASYYHIGNVHANQGNYPKALENYLASLKIKEEIGDRSGMANSYNNIGNVHIYQGNYPKALENHFASLKIMEEIGDRKGMANSYGNIGGVHADQGNYPKALENYFASLKIREEIGDRRGVAYSYNGIGNVHAYQGNYPKALENYLASLKIKEEMGDKKGMAGSYNNIGAVHSDQGNYPKALENHLASLKIKEEIGDRSGMANSYNNIGNVHVQLSNAKEAKEWLQKGLALSTDIAHKETIKSSYEGLAQADSALGNYQAAYENYKMAILYRDSLLNEENTKKTVRLEMQYDFDKKEALTKAEQDKKDFFATKELKMKTQQRNGFIGGFALVLLFAGVFFMQRNRISKEKARSEELLLNILPAETAQELKEKGHSDAQLVDHVTVLFTDFKGFTALSEQLSPKELVRDLHACFSEFDRICAKYGIEKIKTIGDAYMAAGGLPSPNTTHAQDAVKAALEMAQVVEAGKAAKIAANQPFFEIRIGIHTGPVVAGIVGIKKFQYDIWGDTVNTASRMESSGEVGKVNISETTYELVKDQFACEFRGEIEAKGKGKMKMFFVKITEG